MESTGVRATRRPFKRRPVPRLRPSIILRTSGSASGQLFPFLLQSRRGEARDGVPGTREMLQPFRSLRERSGRSVRGSPCPGAGSRGGEGGAGARGRAGGHAQPTACGGARCRAGSMYGREGAAAGKADSTPCAHAPAPAGYKAAAPAPPDKVASCDVTGRPCGCCSQRARRRRGTRAGPRVPRNCGPRRRVTHTPGAARHT